MTSVLGRGYRLVALVLIISIVFLGFPTVSSAAHGNSGVSSSPQVVTSSDNVRCGKPAAQYLQDAEKLYKKIGYGPWVTEAIKSAELLFQICSMLESNRGK